MKINLKPTKRKLFYTTSISIILLIILFFLLAINKPIGKERLSPEEFKIMYIVPILIFLITYFFVCWYITHKHNEDIEWPIKNVK